MYNCFLKPIFYYTDTVWGTLLIRCSNSLQHLQNKAANIILRRARTEESFKMLGWVNLETQRKAHKCSLLFKCLSELVPPYLSDYFIRNRPIHTYKTSQRNNIHLPNPEPFYPHWYMYTFVPYGSPPICLYLKDVIFVKICNFHFIHFLKILLHNFK